MRKGKDKAASSAKALERNPTAGAGLISFSSLGIGVGDGSTSLASRLVPAAACVEEIAPVYGGNNPTIAMLCRKALKKDPTTRIKALQELAACVRDLPTNTAAEGSEEVRALLPHYVYLHSRVCMDNDRRVRESLYLLLVELVRQDKRALGPHMRSLIGPWWVAASDPSHEVSIVAREAFELAIPKKKRQQVCVFLSSHLIRYISEKLSLTVETMSEIGTSCPQEEAEERFERVSVSCLSAITRLLTSLSEEENQQVLVGVAPEVGDTYGYTHVLNEMLWKKTSSKRVPIRQSAYVCLSAMCQHLPQAAVPPGSESKIANTACNFLSEKHVLCVSGAMEALVLLSRAHPDIWTRVDMSQAFFPRLYQQIRSGFGGSNSAMMSLLPLVASLQGTYLTITTDAGQSVCSRLARELMTLQTSEHASEVSQIETVQVCTYILLRNLTDIDPRNIPELLPLTLASVCDVLVRVTVPLLGRTMTAQNSTSVCTAISKLHRGTTRYAEIHDTLKQVLWVPMSVSVLEYLEREGIPSASADAQNNVFDLTVERIWQAMSSTLDDSQVSEDGDVGIYVIVHAYMRAALWTEDNVQVRLTDDAGTSPALTVEYAAWVCGACVLLGPEAAVAIGQRVRKMTQMAVTAVQSSANQAKSIIRDWGVRLLESITSVHTSLARACFRNPEDVLEEILATCIELGSYVCASLVLIHKSVRESQIPTSILNTCEALLLPYLDGEPGNVKYTYMVPLAYACANVDFEFLEIVKNKWTSTHSKVSMWCLLSLASRLPPPTLADLLVQAFKLRLRQEPLQPLDKIANDRVGCVIGWTSAQAQILGNSCVETETFLLFIEGICDSLRTQLHTTMAYVADMTFNVSSWSKHVCGLAEMCEKAHIQTRTQDMSVNSVFRRVGLADPDTFFVAQDKGSVNIFCAALLQTHSLWTSGSSPNPRTSILGSQLDKCTPTCVQPFVETALLLAFASIVGYLQLTGAKPASGSLASAMSTTTVEQWCLFMNVPKPERTLPVTLLEDSTEHEDLHEQSELFEGLWQLFLSTCDFVSAAQVVELLAEACVFVCEHQHQHNLSLAVAEGLSMLLHTCALNNAQARGSGLSLAVDGCAKYIISAERNMCEVCMVAGTVLAKQEDIWYVRSATELLPATVVGVHREGGQDPYYTLKVQPPGQAPRELQTEGKRLLHRSTPCDMHARIYDDPEGESQDLGDVVSSLLGFISNSDPSWSTNSTSTTRLPIVLIHLVALDVVTTVYGPEQRPHSPQVHLLLTSLCTSTVDALLLADNDRDTCKQQQLLCMLSVLARNALCVNAGAYVCAKLMTYLQTLTVNHEPITGEPSHVFVECVVGGIAAVLECVRCEPLAEALCTFVSRCMEQGWLLVESSCVVMCRVLCAVSGCKLKQIPTNAQKRLSDSKIEQTLNVCWNVPMTPFDDTSVFAQPWTHQLFHFALEVVECGLERHHNVVAACVMVCTSFTQPHTYNMEQLASLKLLARQHEDGLLACVCSLSPPPFVRICAAKMCIWGAEVAGMTQALSSLAVREGREEQETKGDAETPLLTAQSDEARDASTFEAVVAQPLARRIQNLFGGGLDALGELLCWIVCMWKIDLIAAYDGVARARMGSYLRGSKVFGSVMRLCVPLLPDATRTETDIPNSLYELLDLPNGERALTQLVAHTLLVTVRSLPAMSRAWWSDEADRKHSAKLLKFVEQRVTPALVDREVALVREASEARRWDTTDMVVRASKITAEVVASYTRDETTIDMSVTLPPAYPFKNVTVECSSRLGIAEQRWRRWQLQIVQLLSMQDGSVVDAVLLWKANVDRELEGVEPCPICYSTLHPKTRTLPSMECPTCHNKFHSQCLSKWFQTSGKSKCVLCQQPFFG